MPFQAPIFVRPVPAPAAGGPLAWAQTVDDTLSLADALSFDRLLALADALTLADVIDTGQGDGEFHPGTLILIPWYPL